ncbi:hypothetical protein XELAEV_18013513mg [Xenopus laevis]|uniref:Uncharacterized protein n=1 Tax=Xenopus laevis TaxID=8355 RepID=A0A974HZ39_XENLA|nr:hypothetical protein XELAEV_18013513mg [Xenopus laevis]
MYQYNDDVLVTQNNDNKVSITLTLQVLYTVESVALALQSPPRCQHCHFSFSGFLFNKSGELQSTCTNHVGTLLYFC